MYEILYGNFSEHSYQLNSLELRGPFTKYGICSLCILFELRNVVSLAIFWGLLEDLFSHEGTICSGKHSELPIKLSSLSLHELRDEFLWKLHPEFNKLSQNLTTLEVYNCNRLIYLLASSMVQSLRQLTTLRIYECHQIEEIIIDVEDGIDDCIIFSQLKFLDLYRLPNLVVFFLGVCKLEFPSLQIVIVNECPSLRRFSLGDLSTPRLHTLQIGENATAWEGDLNTTLQHHYVGTVQVHPLNDI